MSESAMRSSLVQRLSSLDAQSIECPIKTGVPDINFREGWIECKFRPAAPKSPNAVVKFTHPVTVGQKVWMRRRVRCGGRCFLAAKVASEWFFWNVANFNLDVFNTMTMAQMGESCGIHFKRSINTADLIEFLIT